MHWNVGRLIPIVLFAVSMTAGEIPIASVVEGAAVLSQTVESGASDGSDYLFVWIDGRNGGLERRATRVTREGEVLDRDGIPLPSVSSRNGVVWTGTSYMVVWDEGYPAEIRMMRIGRDGTIVDGPHVIKSQAAAMSVASNGTHVVIGYHTHEPPYGAFAKRALFLGPEGNIVADVLLDDSSGRGSLNIGWNGSHFAAIWVNDLDPEDPQYAVEGLRFNVNGKLDAAPRRLFEDSSPSYVATPSLASDGNDFLLVTRAGGERQAARRLSADLGTVGPQRLLPPLDYELLPHLNLSSPILWNGTHYLIAGHDGRAISAVRLDRDGRTAGVDVIENTNGAGTLANPVPVTNGHDLLVGWTGRFSPDPDIGSDVFGTLLSASTLDRRTSTLLSISPQHQRRPLLASGGTNLLAVWQQGLALYARRLSPGGAPLDAVPLRLAERGTPAAVVFNGTDYIVVWPHTVNHQVTGLVTARVPRDGALRVEGGATLPNAFPLAAASDGAATLLLWTKDSVLHASRLAADGSIAATTTLVEPTEEGWPDGATIVAGAGTFLVVWEQMRMSGWHFSPPSQAGSIRGMRLSAELIPLDPVGIDIAVVGRDDRSPAATWNGREWLVIFDSVARTAPPDWEYRPELRGRLVSREGIPTGAPEGVFIAPGGGFPSVAWDGSRYFLTWHNDGLTRVHTATLTTLGGEAVPGNPINRPFDWAPISLLAIRPGVIAATYARPTVEPPYGDVFRAFVNYLTLNQRRRAMR